MLTIWFNLASDLELLQKKNEVFVIAVILGILCSIN